MVHTCVDSALEHLINQYPQQIEALEVDLRLLKLFLSCHITSWDSETNIVSSLECIWDNSYDASKLEEKIQQCKQEINKYSTHLISSCECQSLPLPSNHQILVEFLDEIHNNLNLTVETVVLKEKVLLLRNLVDFTAGRCPDSKDLSDFIIHVHTWANQVACLTCLYWVNYDEEIGKRLDLWLTDLLQKKINPCTPEFVSMCFAVMKSTKFSRADTFILGQFLSSFVDFLLQNLRATWEDYEFEFLFDGLIFLISFLVDTPTGFRYDHVLNGVLDEASHLICSFSRTEKELGRYRMIRSFRLQIEKEYVKIPNFSFPKTNGLGFVDHLLGYIDDLTRTMNGNSNIVFFAKHQISRVKEGLLSLRQTIHVMRELLINEHKEVKDLWDKMIHVAYKAEHAVNSSFTIDHPIWYHLACLSNALKEIKDVRYEFENKTNQFYGTAGAAPKHPLVYKPLFSGMDDIVVGFNDEGQVLIDRITSGTKFDIVPIVGMGGLGKTTLARKLYNEAFVRNHFHVRAFCNIGQEYSSLNILLEILNSIVVNDVGIRTMTKDDLAHRLYKCLKGRRYLIIMDDIWDVTAWEGVKSSFPDDNNGSRVVFTTRISNVALQAKPDCSPHYLRFFTFDESWKLLQAKVFDKDPCPPDLRGVGMLIARKCSGLPLAVVVIAGLLARIPKTLSSWNKIADDLNSYVSSEGGMGTLELSYKQLPEALKPCFLYFGAFIKDRTITTKRLMLMWAAEGFLPKSMSERNSSLTSQYLNDLVDRSLVIVNSRSSTGGIKHCSVHDVIRDLCQAKSQEEQFFRYIRFSIFTRLSIPVVFEQYRLCINSEWESFVGADASGPNAHTLICAPIFPHEQYSEEPFPYKNFKLLQLLDLQDVKTQMVDLDFPEEVTTLVNLRYLALANLSFKHVPPTIANLWNLETFILKAEYNWELLVLPDTIWKMKKLKHVDVGTYAFVNLDSDVGKESSKLPNVESFSSVTIDDHGEAQELLRRLSNARKLSLYLKQKKECHQLPSLDHLTMLESLRMIWKGSFHPSVFTLPATLKKLNLSEFFLPWSEFPTIIANQLPCLEALRLSHNAFKGHTWDMEEVELPCLKYLELEQLDVADWIASVDSFPCLERLIVSACFKLVEIPSCFGEIPTMKSIELYQGNLEAAAIGIQKEQREMGNGSFEVLILSRSIQYTPGMFSREIPVQSQYWENYPPMKEKISRIDSGKLFM